MIHLEWGISPDIETSAAWGARGIINSGELELLWDRQSAHFENENLKSEFIAWMDYFALPRINEEIKYRAGGWHCKCDFTSEAGRFRCVADDRDSGGYIYIGAWAIENET